MKTYLFSAPGLGGFGEYSYRSISLEEASRRLKGGFVSAVRYQWDADMLRDLLGIHVPINRGEVRLEVGDSAVVVEPPGTDPSGEASGRPPCVGLITRTA